ncbi:hypothetical protein HMN09_00617700 [Mycena chlorophos]|uniref:Uncharacterized protein n=1 Tax=Mycena chlorophos TaxID=658473 RepID=A0A8H6T5H4_MYCCL|nr:hypothetical protein HMN09_00617700 [Mycena chlorophos]
MSVSTSKVTALLDEWRVHWDDVPKPAALETVRSLPFIGLQMYQEEVGETEENVPMDDCAESLLSMNLGESSAEIDKAPVASQDTMTIDRTPYSRDTPPPIPEIPSTPSARDTQKNVARDPQSDGPSDKAPVASLDSPVPASTCVTERTTQWTVSEESAAAMDRCSSKCVNGSGTEGDS